MIKNVSGAFMRFSLKILFLATLLTGLSHCLISNLNNGLDPDTGNGLILGISLSELYLRQNMCKYDQESSKFGAVPQDCRFGP